MRHIGGDIRIRRCFAYEEIIHNVCHVAHLESVHRITRFHAVNSVPIVVKFGLKPLRGKRPDITCTLHVTHAVTQIRLPFHTKGIRREAVTRDLHPLSLGRI